MILVKDGGLDQRGSNERSENSFGSVFILKVDSIRFAGQLGCGMKERGQGL